MTLKSVLAAVVVLAASQANALELWVLRAKSVHCATPEPIATGNVYPLKQRGCALVLTDWGLLAPPKEARPGVVKIEMGGIFGVRYAGASDVFRVP